MVGNDQFSVATMESAQVGFFLWGGILALFLLVYARIAWQCVMTASIVLYHLASSGYIWLIALLSVFLWVSFSCLQRFYYHRGKSSNVVKVTGL